MFTFNAWVMKQWQSKKGLTLMFLPTWSERPLLLRETNSVDMTTTECLGYLQTETTCKTRHIKKQEKQNRNKVGTKASKTSHLSAKGQEQEKLEVNRSNLHWKKNQQCFARKQHIIKIQRHPRPSLCWNSHQTVSSVVPEEPSPISCKRIYLPKCPKRKENYILGCTLLTCGNTQTPTRSLSLKQVR